MNLPLRPNGIDCGSFSADLSGCVRCHASSRQHDLFPSRCRWRLDGRILAVRSQFLSTGVMPEGLPASLVRSWQRSRHFGFAPPALRQRDRLGDAGLKSLKERNGELIASAWEEMVSLGQELSEQGGAVVLTDPSGIVLSRHGVGSFAGEADRLGLNEGFDWSEQAIGTNAIGTVALEKAPLTVIGAEHLFCLNTSLGCSAVPILDPSGALAGVLDVSTSLAVPHDYLLLLLKRSVLEIERRLFEQRFPRQLKLRFHSSEHLFGGIRDGLLAFDDDRLVGANRAALELLGRDWSIVGLVRFRELFETEWDAVEAQSGSLCSIDGREFFARLQGPVRSSAGAFLKSSSRPAQTGGGEMRPHLALERLRDRGTLRFRKMRAGQLIYGGDLLDESGEAIVIFASGRYRCFASHEGRELTLFMLGCGDALPMGPDLAVEVCNDGEAAIIPRALFQRLCRTYPEFGNCVLSVIEGLLGQSVSMVGDMAFRSVRHRVIRHVCALADQQGRETPAGTVIEMAPSGDELATAIGAARQSVSTVLAELIRSGDLMRPNPRSLVISDIARLKAELRRSSQP